MAEAAVGLGPGVAEAKFAFSATTDPDDTEALMRWVLALLVAAVIAAIFTGSDVATALSEAKTEADALIRSYNDRN